MPPESHGANDWFAFAVEDLAIARSEHDDNPFARGLRAYHCQQAAEKSIKAVLMHRGDAVPRTHHVGDLIDALPGEYHAQLTSARQLTIYATASRYPDEILEVQERHLDEAIAIAAAIVHWARTIVRP